MNKSQLLAVALTAFAVLGSPLSAQEKLKTDGKMPAATLKLQVTIVEREGDKKVTNLPYTFFVRAGGAVLSHLGPSCVPEAVSPSMLERTEGCSISTSGRISTRAE